MPDRWRQKPSGNPYDGHTLNVQVNQASILMQAIGIKPETVFVGLDHRGVNTVNPVIDITHRAKLKA